MNKNWRVKLCTYEAQTDVVKEPPKWSLIVDKKDTCIKFGLMVKTPLNKVFGQAWFKEIHFCDFLTNEEIKLRPQSVNFLFQIWIDMWLFKESGLSNKEKGFRHYQGRRQLVLGTEHRWKRKHKAGGSRHSQGRRRLVLRSEQKKN